MVDTTLDVVMVVEERVVDMNVEDMRVDIVVV